MVWCLVCLGDLGRYRAELCAGPASLPARYYTLASRLRPAAGLGQVRLSAVTAPTAAGPEVQLEREREREGGLVLTLLEKDLARAQAEGAPRPASPWAALAPSPPEQRLVAGDFRARRRHQGARHLPLQAVAGGRPEGPRHPEQVPAPRHLQGHSQSAKNIEPP